MSILGASISIKFDGSVDDLKTRVDAISNILGRRNYYSNDINRIKTDIIPNFEKYKEYNPIYLKTMILRNESIPNFNPYFESIESKKVNNDPLYGWIYTKILMYIFLFILLIFIITSCYCYVTGIDTYKYITTLFI